MKAKDKIYMKAKNDKSITLVFFVVVVKKVAFCVFFLNYVCSLLIVLFS